MSSFDPLILPIDSIAGEARLDDARMQEDWLRDRFVPIHSRGRPN